MELGPDNAMSEWLLTALGQVVVKTIQISDPENTEKKLVNELVIKPH